MPGRRTPTLVQSNLIAVSFRWFTASKAKPISSAFSLIPIAADDWAALTRMSWARMRKHRVGLAAACDSIPTNAFSAIRAALRPQPADPRRD